MGWYKKIIISCYYIISITLILFSIISFYINNKIKSYLIIIFSSFVIAIYSFEAFLTLNAEKGADIYKKQTGKNFDTRTRFEVYNDMKKNNENITVIVPPSPYLSKKSDLYPLSGISNAKTIFCNESGYYSIYQSDRYGFNNPDSEWDNEVIDFLIIGDSFGEGACVNSPNDIASILRRFSV